VALEAQRALMGPTDVGTSTVTGAVVGTGPAPPPSQPAPHSAGGDNSAPVLGNAGGGTDTSIPELKPAGEAALPAMQAPQAAPAQVNEAAGDAQSSSSTAAGSQEASSSSSSVQGSNDAQSSSKTKKKKKKLWPF